MNTSLIPSSLGGLVSTGDSRKGRELSRPVARSLDRELDMLTAKGQVARTLDTTRAVLATGAIQNTAGLVGFAMQCAEIAPAGEEYYARIIHTYASGASNLIEEFG